jgi:hypothetical protein
VAEGSSVSLVGPKACVNCAPGSGDVKPMLALDTAFAEVA